MPVPHPEDTLLVRNINVGDPDFPEFFPVYWNSVRFKVPVGQVRRLPRYLAFHFNKHLTDRIIYLQDLARPKDKQSTSNLRNEALRNSLQGKIVVAVEQYFTADDDDARKSLMKMYNQLNNEDAEVAQNLGTVTTPEEPPFIDTLPQDESGNPVFKKEEEFKSPIQQDKPKTEEKKRTREDLLKEANDLGIDVTGKESYPELEEKIKSF